MKKKILIMTVFTLVVMTLPLITIAQAKQGGMPTEIYRDLVVWGRIVPDGPAVDVVKRGNIQCARYTAKSYAPWNLDMEWVTIYWGGTPGPMGDAESLTGTGAYDIDYKINLNTMKGVVHITTKITLIGGTFEGEMFWIGELELETEGENTNTVKLGTGKWHTFWKGTGEYDGWTVVQNMQGWPQAHNEHDMIRNNHLIKPVTE